MNLVDALFHPPFDTLKDIGSVGRDHLSQREGVVEVPGTGDHDTGGAEAVEVIEDAPDDPDILTKAMLIGAVTAVGVVEVHMEARGKVY